MGNPAEETCRYPNQILCHSKTLLEFVNSETIKKITFRCRGFPDITPAQPKACPGFRLS